MSIRFGHAFPAIRGTQAGREYYVSMVPLRLIPQIFMFDEEELRPEIRAQRVLNRTRIPEMSRYILENPSSYTFSALTASIDGGIEFESLEEDGDASDVGVLRVAGTAKFIINDGQHRRAAIESAIRERPEIADETIAVVFYLDIHLKRSQQMFSDLNRYAIRPSRSLNVLYDYRDDLSILCRELVLTSEVFKEVVELEKSTLATRSGKLFTLSAIYTANKSLLAGIESESGEALRTVAAFWEEVDKHIPQWKKVREQDMPSSEVRQGYIHSHAVALHALGKAGNVLIRRPKREWEARLKKLGSINWRRTNPAWEGRAIVGGTVSKSMNNVVLTCNVIKQQMGLELTPDEQRIEDAHTRGEV